MESMYYKTIQNYARLISGALVLGLFSSPIKAQELSLELGYNALETAIAAEENPEGRRPVRNRLITNLTLDVGDFEIGHHGLNEIDDWDLESYFGRNRIFFGPEDLGIKALIDTRADHKGIFDTKVGLRYAGLGELLRGYGYMDIGVNDEAVGLDVFYGRPLGYGFTPEFLQVFQFPYDGKRTSFTELQVNKDITDRVALFGRIEIPDFDPGNAIYLVGFTFKLN